MDGYECTVDNEAFQRALHISAKELDKCYPKLLVSPAASESSAPALEWSPSRVKRFHYNPLVAFLNTCVAIGTKALDMESQSLSGWWYNDLQFVKYGKTIGDGAGCTASLRPSIGGGNGLKNGEPLFWRPPDGYKQQMQLPVEVNRSWAGLVLKGAMSARCLFSANPSRTFALVLGFHPSDQCLRFLIFHSGGLTSSTALSLKEPLARIDVLRLIMTLLLWTTPQDAGFISSSDDFGYLVAQPTDPSQYVPTSIEEVLYDSTCVRGQATSVFRLKCCPSSGGVIGAPASQPSVADIKRHIGPDSQSSGKNCFAFCLFDIL